MLNKFTVLIAFAQAAVPAAPAETVPQPLFQLRQGSESAPAPLPIVDLNGTRSVRERENPRLLDEAGLPMVAGYTSPIIRYHEFSPYHYDNPVRHLLVQFAITGDNRGMQVIAVEAIERSSYSWEIKRKLVAYGAPETFHSLAPAIIDSAARLPHYSLGIVQVCSHVPGAQLHIQIPGEIAVDRHMVCGQGPPKAAGDQLIIEAERVLGKKIERAGVSIAPKERPGTQGLN